MCRGSARLESNMAVLCSITKVRTSLSIHEAGSARDEVKVPHSTMLATSV